MRLVGGAAGSGINADTVSSSLQVATMMVPSGVMVGENRTNELVFKRVRVVLLTVGPLSVDKPVCYALP